MYFLLNISYFQISEISNISIMIIHKIYIYKHKALTSSDIAALIVIGNGFDIKHNINPEKDQV